MTLSKLPHRVINSLKDSEGNWEWLFNNSSSSADLAGQGLDEADGVLSVNESELIGITDASLASPNNSTYKTIYHGSMRSEADAAAGTRLFGPQDNVLSSGVDYGLFFRPDLIPFNSADYAVTGTTTKLRIRAIVATNATAPGINFTFHLYAVTFTGAAADTLRHTVGASQGSVAINTPGASAATQTASSDLTIPADGVYLPAVVSSGTLANNAAVACHFYLQVRNV